MKDAGTPAPAPIPRRLRRTDPTTGATEIISESEISGLAGPIVILGDPGLGKSVLTQTLGAGSGNRYVRAGSFVRNKAPASFLPAADGRLVIDGLDEVASNVTGGGVDAVLAQLSAIGNPPFILSSREADWRGASARVEIEDDYGETVAVLHLEPFTRDEADRFLRDFFPKVDADVVLDHLAARGLEDIYGNPLTLRMIGEVAQAETNLPATRAELLERACAILLREENPRHLQAEHALRSDESLLLAAGAVCASLLLCDRAGVYLGATGKTPEDFLHRSDITDLPFGEAAPDALKTRLFQADGEARFVPVHRVVAEYLGARWLAACFEKDVSERRLRSLISSGGGIPTSLRGLNAWLAHFSGALAPAAIAADPYAVLRYGNAETLPLEQASALLDALANLSVEDPYFRAEDWNRHPAAGLMRAELKDEVLKLLSDEETHTHLSFLLLEAMVGSPIAAALADDLKEIVFDPQRYFGSRSRAVDALVAAGALTPAAPIVRRLLALGDRDSHRLAFELAAELGFGAVPPALTVEALLAYACVTVSPLDRKEREHSIFVSRQLFGGAPAEVLHTFLDELADYAGPLIESCGHWSKEGVVDVGRQAILAALPDEVGIDPARLWRWLRWIGHRHGYDDDAKTALTNLFRDRTELRRAIQVAVILDAATADIRFRAFELAEVCGTLHPDEGDVVAMIALAGEEASGAADLARLRELVSLALSRSGLPPAVREAASKLARGDAAFLADLDEWSRPVVYDYEKKEKRRAAARAASRRATYQRIREDHAAHVAEIRDGAVQWLETPSKVYLGRYSEFAQGATPEGRVETLLGEELAQDALAGFMAALHRTDLPTPDEIAKAHAAGQRWTIETALVCGVAEMIRRGLGLATVPRAALESSYMAWRRQSESNVVGGIDIGPPLEALVLDTPADAESFFRTSIEPQLNAKLAYVYDLYLLTNGNRCPALAGRLAAEWLISRGDLPPGIESELLDAALRDAEAAELERVLAASRARVHADRDTLLGWVAADFVLDFEYSKPQVTQAARDEPAFIWSIRNRVGGRRGDALGRLSIAQRAFIVEVFGERWPQVNRPEGSSTGDQNPWDASAFLERAIYSLAAEPSSEATQMLQSLQVAGASSYGPVLRHALAQQRRLRRDHEYAPATMALVASVASNALPESIDDMRAYFGDRLGVVRDRMHGSNTDMWEAYWDGPKPRPENFCRNRLIEHISGQLPAAIRFEPEMHMPGQTRADIAAIREAIGLPVEIKGQWHAQVWDAPVDQLAARYARDWRAEGRGAYIVLWFGDAPGKTLTKHPDGLDPPATPEELALMLVDRIPESLRDLIDVYVVDVSRPK